MDNNRATLAFGDNFFFFTKGLSAKGMAFGDNLKIINYRIVIVQVAKKEIYFPVDE